MDKNKIICFFLFATLLSSCKWQSYSDYALPEYDGALTWTQIVKNSEWSDRYDHEATAFKNKLWILGGYNPGQVSGDTYYEDVWSSNDGEYWDLVIEDAPWKGRRGHQVVVFDDGNGEAMFLIGGFSVDEATGYRQYNNDVWRSIDGVNWNLIKERTYPDINSDQDWFPRMYHKCVISNQGGVDYIYLIAGRTMLEGHDSRYATEYFNDAWRSVDAINWERLPNNDFGIRAEHAVAVDGDGNIYINGGVHGIIFEGDNNASHPIPLWQALWASPTGNAWTPSRDSVEVEDGFLYRSAHEIVFYKDLLWSLPGKTTSNVHYHFTEPGHYPIWTYDPAGYWAMDSRGAAIDARHSYEALVWRDKIWIFGGFTGTYGQSSDVWTGEL